VRKHLIHSDAVLPALDAGTEALYRKINRPWPELTFERLVSGLTTFRREYGGKLWIEVMLIRGVNDTELALKDLARVINGIGPDEVHLNLPIRPPSEPWVNPSGEEGLNRARSLLGEVAKVVPPAGGVFDLSTYEDVMDAVIGVITRHPMLEEEILQTLERWTPGQVEDVFARLSESGKAKAVSRYGKRFWSFTGAKYA
jgi:wyosine [tRNA(Phe)-imidazoG37] synthetase (radical SAM superfamily)